MHWAGGIIGAVLGLMLADWDNDANCRRLAGHAGRGSAGVADTPVAAEGGERLAVRCAEPFWRTTGAAPLLGTLSLWVAAVNPVLAGSLAPLPYLSLLNPLDLMTIITVVLVWRSWLTRDSPLLAAAVAVTGLFLLTCMLARAVHQKLPAEPRGAAREP